MRFNLKMNITLNTLEETTQKAFKQALMGNTKMVDEVFFELAHIRDNNDALADMLTWEFNSYWNSLYAREVLENTISVDFPMQVEAYPSQWFLLWKEYFSQKFYETQKPMNERRYDEIAQEVEKVKLFFSHLPQHYDSERIDKTVANLLASIPYRAATDHFFDEQNALEHAIFKIAKVEHFNFFYDDLKDDLVSILSAYYAKYKYGNNVIFSTYVSKGQDIDEVIYKKKEFFAPKNEQERFFLVKMSANRNVFIEALNQVGGLTSGDKSKQEEVKMAFLEILLTEDALALAAKLKQKTSVSKKTKI